MWAAKELKKAKIRPAMIKTHPQCQNDKDIYSLKMVNRCSVGVGIRRAGQFSPNTDEVRLEPCADRLRSPIRGG
ncbi:hypothetical protein TNCV_4805591 [Trichonephila clavipes]|nr:hypothetical protein TNCV_4805591 [Trichonephila clavipes]